MYFIVLLSLLFFAVSVVFALQNSNMVVVRFLMWQFNIQIALLILAAFFVGFLSNIFLSFPHRLKNNRLVSQNAKLIKKMEEDLNKYRTLLLGSRKQ